MMMRSGLSIRLDYDRAGPQLARSGSRVGDGGGPGHTGSLGCVEVQVAGRNDFHAVVLPVHHLQDSRWESLRDGRLPSTATGLY
jgi:hypothetical protein